MIRLPRWVLVVLLVFSVVLAFAGIGMIATGAEGGWIGFLFFGLCALVFTVELRPGLLLTQKPETAEALLQRFPGPVELHIPQRKTLLLLIGSIIFAAAMIWTLYKEQPGPVVAWLLWICAAVTVLAIPFVLYQFIRGASLRLEEDGFRVKQPWRWHFVYWRDVSEFSVADAGVLSLAQCPMVVFDEASTKDGTIAAFNRSLIGRSGALPDSYGLAPEELQALMNGWRERALQMLEVSSPPR